MTGRAWKPGDVAMVSVDINDEPRIMLRDETGWSDREATFYWDKAQDRWTITDVRPLVVIDPEDREQVERLWDALETEWSDDGWLKTQAALRSLVADPKPEEPTGLGAVVEDAEGERWVRLPIPDFDKPWTDVAGVGCHVHWSRVAAVRVLSPGYDPEADR